MMLRVWNLSGEGTAYLQQPSPGRNCTRLSRAFVVTKGGSRQTASPLHRSGYYARLLISSYNARAGPVARRWVLVSCTPNASSRPLNYCRIPSSLPALHPRGMRLASPSRIIGKLSCPVIDYCVRRRVLTAGFQFRDYSVSYFAGRNFERVDNRGRIGRIIVRVLRNEFRNR